MVREIYDTYRPEFRNLRSDQETEVDDRKLKEACKDFESVFLYMMFREMGNTVPNNGLVNKSQAMEIFQDMYMEEISREASKDEDNLGLAKIMYEQFKMKGKIDLK